MQVPPFTSFTDPVPRFIVLLALFPVTILLAEMSLTRLVELNASIRFEVQEPALRTDNGKSTAPKTTRQVHHHRLTVPIVEDGDCRSYRGSLLTFESGPSLAPTQSGRTASPIGPRYRTVYPAGWTRFKICRESPGSGCQPHPVTHFILRFRSRPCTQQP